MHQTSKQSNNGTITPASFPTSRLLPLTLALMVVPFGYSGATEAAKTTEPTKIEMVALMEQHYNAAISSHDALIRGDLKTLRNQLAKITTQTLPAAAPKSWQPHHARLHEAARGATDVSNLETAAAVMSNVVEACGTCHAALGVDKIYYWPAPPDQDDKLKTAMRTHQWATERLWEGVTGSLDEAWNRGATALAEAKVFHKKRDSVKSALLARESALREAGQTAKTTTGLHNRAAIYGQLLTTCSKCHQEAGVSIKEIKSIPPWQQ